MDQIEQAYRALELEPEKSTSIREVNQAYKDLVFIWHPDRIPSDRQRLREKAETKLKQLNEARAMMRSQAKNGRVPAAIQSETKSPYARTSSTQTAAKRREPRSYSTYRPGDDSTYRPQSRTASQSVNSQDSSRAGGYRPPYEAYRRAAAATSSTDFSGQYGATYRARYPSSAWPRSSPPTSENGNGDVSDRTASERAARDKVVAERKAREKAAREQATAERRVRERAAREKVIAERKAREQAAYEKATRDQAAKDKAAKDKAARDRASSEITAKKNSTPTTTPSSPTRTKRASDLSGVDMSGANLKEKDFSGRNLSGANLSGADLSDTFMHKVNLNRANLRKARLFRANLLQADLSHADLSGADLIGADLSGADLSGAKVGYGDKIMVKLLGARLTGTIMPNGRIHE